MTDRIDLAGLPRRVREKREALGLSRSAASREIGVNSKALACLEAGCTPCRPHYRRYRDWLAGRPLTPPRPRLRVLPPRPRLRVLPPLDSPGAAEAWVQAARALPRNLITASDP